MTHDISSTLAESDPCMCGMATFVTLVSSTCMTVTIMTENVMAHRRPGETGASVVVGLVDDCVERCRIRRHRDHHHRGRQRIEIQRLAFDDRLDAPRVADRALLD